ncbi:MAG: ABC transporter ATP-binding protein [Saccharofermentans sp.]|nr:ABC transporter ATP-binding protein [Saccharofermentans sp.]
MENVIELKSVSKVYKSKGVDDVVALDNMTLEVGKGEFIAICGVSGSGKSTLLHIIGCLDRPTSGTVLVSGTDVSTLNDVALSKIRNDKIGIVLQDFALIPYRTAYDNVMVPLYFSKNKKNAHKRIMESLEKTGVADLAKREIRKMSGGQKQRVAIARSLVNNPDIILADEPTGQLDSKTKKEIAELFKAINAEGRTILVVTHDDGLAKTADRIIRISDGKIVSADEMI